MDEQKTRRLSWHEGNICLDQEEQGEGAYCPEPFADIDIELTDLDFAGSLFDALAVVYCRHCTFDGESCGNTMFGGHMRGEATLASFRS